MWQGEVKRVVSHQASSCDLATLPSLALGSLAMTRHSNEIRTVEEFEALQEAQLGWIVNLDTSTRRGAPTELQADRHEHLFREGD
jgi:hypothetical protein